MSDPIVVVPHRRAWRAAFLVESQHLQAALSELRPAIEHIGSTAVPGLAAKPVIDMLVGVRSLPEFEAHRTRLAERGFEYVPEYEHALPDRRFFRRMLRGVRTHHVHVVQFNGPYWKRYLEFRDRLRGDRRLAALYAALKCRLAGLFPNDRDAYTNGKSEFVNAVLALPAPARRRRHRSVAGGVNVVR